MKRKNYGLCSHCADKIKPFKYALPNWLCKYCYEAKFPRRKSRFLSYSGLGKSYIRDEESYEFLKKELYDKPGLYERSFRALQDYSPLMKNFPSLKRLLDFVRGHRRRIREIKKELVGLARTHQWLRPQVMEILLFVLWDDLRDKYGEGEGFSDGYYDLIAETITTDYTDYTDYLSRGTRDTDGLDMEQPCSDDDTPPPVPENNKGIWNYMASKVLSEAVAKGIVSQLEAEVVMEKVVYERDFFDIQEILKVSAFEAFALYQSALSKLERWAKGNVLVLPDGEIICD